MKGWRGVQVRQPFRGFSSNLHSLQIRTILVRGFHPVVLGLPGPTSLSNLVAAYCLVAGLPVPGAEFRLAWGKKYHQVRFHGKIKLDFPVSY